MNRIISLVLHTILLCCIKSCLSQTNEWLDMNNGRCSVEIGFIQNILHELKLQRAEILNLKSELLQISERLPTNCMEAGGASFKSDIYTIKDGRVSETPFTVWCDEETENGGWLVIQRRVNADVDFNRDWSAYKTGFGSLSGNYWIGLEKLHALTASASCEQELFIKLQAFDGKEYYAKYDSFVIGSEREDYILKKVGNYTGNAADCFKYHEGCKFSTYDRDNDQLPDESCAKELEGGWWYKKCYWSNLNGKYSQKDNVKSITWNGVGKKESLKYVQMMIRPTEKCMQRLSMKSVFLREKIMK